MAHQSHSLVPPSQRSTPPVREDRAGPSRNRGAWHQPGKPPYRTAAVYPQPRLSALRRLLPRTGVPGWAALAPSAQLSCVLTCGAQGEEEEEEEEEEEQEEQEGQARGDRAIRAAQALLGVPKPYLLRITATNCSALPDSLLSVPETLQHLWIKEPEGSWPPHLLQGLPRFRSLETLSMQARPPGGRLASLQLRCRFWTSG